MRDTWVSRDVRAGCFTCHGGHAAWTGKNAQGVAARHHDSTGHPTWVDVSMSIRYGEEKESTDATECRTSTGGGVGA